MSVAGGAVAALVSYSGRLFHQHAKVSVGQRSTNRKMPLKYVDEKTLLRGLVLRWSGENGRSTLKRGRHPRPRPMATAVVRGEQVGLPPAGSAPATGHMSLYYSTTAGSGRDQASDFIRDWHMSKLHVKPFTNSNA